MNTKICSNCKQELDKSRFSKNKAKKDGLNYSCKECHSKYWRQHYLDNRQKYIKKAVELKKTNQDWWREYKSQFCCVECGEKHQACIDFHHTSDNKENNVAKLAADGCKKKIIAEIAKCIPLCRNCHAKLHWEEKHG